MELMFYVLAPFLTRLSWRSLAAIAASSLALRLAGVSVARLITVCGRAASFRPCYFSFLLGMLAHRTLPFVARSCRSYLAGS